MNTITVEFTNELGAQYVVLRTFKAVPYAIGKHIMGLKAVDGAIDEGDAAQVFTAAVIQALVVDGCVYNAFDGEPIDIKAKKYALDDLPFEAVGAILAKFNEMKAQVEDPKS